MTLGRVIAKVAIGLCLLGALVTSKISLFQLELKARQDASAYAALVTAIAIPYFVTCLVSTKNHMQLPKEMKRSLTIKEIFVLFIRSSLEMLGVVLIVLRMCISQSAVLSATLSISVAIFPAIAQLITTFTHSKSPDSRRPIISTVPQRAGMQARGPCGCGTQTRSVPRGPKCRKSNRRILFIGIALNIAALTIVAVFHNEVFIECFAGVLLVSLTWFDVYLPHQAAIYFEKRHVASAYRSATSLLALMVLSAAFIGLVPDASYTSAQFWTSFQDLFSNWNGNSKTLLVNCVTTYLCYFLSLTACQLRMQFWSFAVPIALSPLVLIAMLSIDCRTSGIAPSLEVDCTLESKSTFDISWEYVAFGFSYIAFLMASMNMFSRKFTRPLAKECDIFESPGYSIFSEALALNHKATKTAFDRFQGQASTLYVCATLYRENKNEMKQLCGSLNRVRAAWQGGNRKLKFIIVVDQAFDYRGESRSPKLNEFGRQLKAVLDAEFRGIKIDSYNNEEQGWTWVCRLPSKDGSAASVDSAQDDTSIISDPNADIQASAASSPVTARPSADEMIVIFKDPKLIRKGKRWSQIAYLDHIEATFQDGNAGWSYLLTLDGDVDFQPSAVDALINKLDVDHTLGGVCGRVKAMGNPMSINPLVWFQKFEYEQGHFMNKTAEAQYGSVMCLPGCFSMFRLCCLARERKSYAKVATTGYESLQCDQGEDRWLAALLLAGGSSLAYVSTAVASSFCPEQFSELFNQRRRWISSTIINQLNLLASGKVIVDMSGSINWLFIAYQGLMLVSTLLSPAVVTLLILQGLDGAIGLNSWLFSTFFVLLQVAYVCLLISRSVTKETKMFVTGLLCMIYMILMGVIVVGLARQMVLDPLSASSIFFVTICAVTLLASIISLEGLLLFKYGLFYLMCVPAAYLVLPLYAYANMVDSSWSTREKTARGELMRSNPSSMCWCQRHSQTEVLTYTCGWCSTPSMVVADGALKPEIQVQPMVVIDDADVPDVCHDENVRIMRGTFLNTSDWLDRQVLFWTPEMRAEEITVEEAKKDSLEALRATMLAVIAVVTITWIVMQLAVMKYHTLDISSTGTNILGLLFLIVFAFVSLLQFFAAVMSGWSMLMESLSNASSKDAFAAPKDHLHYSDDDEEAYAEISS